jgi:ferredoxin--NADP+ reductase
MEGVALHVDPAEAELDEVSREWLAEEGTFTARKNVELLAEFAEQPPEGDRSRIVLRFLRSPAAIRGAGRVEAIDLAANVLARGEDGTLRARSDGEVVETLECGLVLRSVGYRAVPLPDVPFDERAFILPNDRGRALTPEGDPLPGVYAVGWIKRGPTGILGTNKRDADETIARLAEDLRAGLLPQPAKPEREAIDALLAERCPEAIDADGWRAIDAAERARGRSEERPRVKLASRDELLGAAAG